MAELSVVSVRPASQLRCHVLEEDPDLAEAIPESRRDQAIEALTAPVIRVPAGPWPAEGSPHGDADVGLLVFKGLMLRRVGVEGRYGAELVGECDIVKPGQGEERPSPTLSTTTGWSVIEPTRMAILDGDFARAMMDYPELVGRLVGRAVSRCRNMAVNMAIVHQARVDVRLHMLFWHLAGRWGRVRSDGTLLPVRLTHAVLADLVAARRPTVTSALSDLTRRGLVRLTDDGCLLTGEPPGELLDVSSLG